MIRAKIVAMLTAILAVFGVSWPGGPRLTYGGGYYTNICGSGRQLTYTDVLGIAIRQRGCVRVRVFLWLSGNAMLSLLNVEKMKAGLIIRT